MFDILGCGGQHRVGRTGAQPVGQGRAAAGGAGKTVACGHCRMGAEPQPVFQLGHKDGVGHPGGIGHKRGVWVRAGRLVAEDGRLIWGGLGSGCGGGHFDFDQKLGAGEA